MNYVTWDLNWATVITNRIPYRATSVYTKVNFTVQIIVCCIVDIQRGHLDLSLSIASET